MRFPLSELNWHEIAALNLILNGDDLQTFSYYVSHKEGITWNEYFLLYRRTSSF